MSSEQSENRQVYWTVAIAVTILAAISSTVFSLTHGIYEVYPFLYFLPIILFVYFYPDKGVIFSVAMSLVYLLLVYLLSSFNTQLIAVSTGWFVIFVTIGFVTSSLAGGLRAEEKKYRGIFENSQAGIFTFELSTLRIRDVNARCARMLKYDREDLIGKDLTRVLLDSVSRDAFLERIKKSRQSGDSELLFHTRDGLVRQFLVSATLTPNDVVICSAIDITERRLAERVIQKARDDLERRVRERTEELLRSNEELKTEILERKKFEDAIRLANRKLNTLSNITRHDILNQIAAIVMYLSLTEEMTTESATIANLRKIEKITQLIQKQIQFTRDYQNIGASAPQWQNVAAIIDESITDVDLGGLRVERDTGSLEIYADLLLSKVFYNLVENTIRHGGNATVIRFSYEETGTGLTLICEDNGTGVPAPAKERIFRREYYRNTGYGLFLADEILGITGITIREVGKPGEGARFLIGVPPGAYRFPLKKEMPKERGTCP